MGLLVGGLDETGPHLYQNCPSGNYFEYQAFAIGSRSQAAKTYLERKFDTFMGCTKEELIRHALFAVKESLQDEELSITNCSVAVLGIDEPFQILDVKTLQSFIDGLEEKTVDEPEVGEPITDSVDEPEVAPAAEEEGDGAAPMES